MFVNGNDLGHKWLRCILSAGANGKSTLDNIDNIYHLQAASNVFFCHTKSKVARWQHVEDWIVTTQATDLWQHYLNEFWILILTWLCINVGFTPRALNALPTDMQAQSHESATRLGMIFYITRAATWIENLRKFALNSCLSSTALQQIAGGDGMIRQGSAPILA